MLAFAGAAATGVLATREAEAVPFDTLVDDIAKSDNPAGETPDGTEVETVSNHRRDRRYDRRDRRYWRRQDRRNYRAWRRSDRWNRRRGRYVCRTYWDNWGRRRRRCSWRRW
jgi:hypothetical protein